jgi:hypothetical protein
MNLGIHIRSYRFSLINCIAFAGSLCFVLAFFSRLPDYNIDSFFSSDSLYLPSIYKDLFLDGNSLKEWRLNPSPNFFPDMVFYFLLMLVCKNSFIVSSFIFAIVQYIAILTIVSYIFKTILPKASKHWLALIYLLFTLFLMEYLFFTTEYYYSFYLVSNAFHTGAFVMTLLCFLWSVKYYKTSSYKFLLYILITGVLCIVSDRLFIVLYCIPVFVSGFFLIKRISTRQVLLHSLTIVALVLLGMTAFNTFGGGNYFETDNPHGLITFENIKSSFSIFSEQMHTYLSEFGFKAITIYLFLLSFFTAIYLFFHTRKNGDLMMYYYTIFSIVFSLVVLSAPIINGNYTGYDTLRYNIYPFYLMALNIPLFLAYTIKKEKLLAVGKNVLAAVCLIVLVGGISSINRKDLARYFSYYPESVRSLDGLAEKYGLLCGVGNYWEAKKITMFSKKGLKVYPVLDDLVLSGHVTNINWFYTSKFNFILTNNFRDTMSVRNKVLWSKSIANTANLGLIKTNVFTYRKDKGSLPINSSGSE